MRNANSDELSHYGVKGMKWGVRKDRFSSGHLGDSARRKLSSTYENPSGSRKRPAYTKKGYQLTDKQLDQRIARLSKEKKYQDLQRDVESTTASRGRRWVNQALDNVGPMALTALGTYGVAYVVNRKMGDKVIGLKTKDKIFPGL